MTNPMRDNVLEEGTTVGDGATLTLGGAVTPDRRRFRDVFDDGTPVFYVDATEEETPGDAKREAGFGVLTYGTPDTIVRAVIWSTEEGDARVDWQESDIHTVYVAPLLDALGFLLVGNMTTELPAWARNGFERFDDSAGIAVRLIRKLLAQGVETETGRYHGANGVYTASLSMDVLDTGTAGVTVDATHKDKFLYANVTAASRTFTLGAVATYAKGFSFGVYGYGATGNNIALTPNGAEKINEGTGGAALNIAGGSPKVVRADHLRGAWIVHG